MNSGGKCDSGPGHILFRSPWLLRTQVGFGPTSRFTRICSRVCAEPVTPPVDSFLKNASPKLFIDAYGEAYGFVREADKSLSYRTPTPEDYVLFWTGSACEYARYDETFYFVGDHIRIAKSIAALAESLGYSDPLVVDLGAGTCIQGIALRAAGLSFPILNLDYFPWPLQIGELLATQLGLSGFLFHNIDINEQLSASKSTEDFAEFVKGIAADRPIIVTSRHALHPFFSVPEYERLFSFLTETLNADAGVHVEMCGHRTAAFLAVDTFFDGNPPVANKIKDEPGDPLTYLEQSGLVDVVERHQIWAHFVNLRYPSFISWKRC